MGENYSMTNNRGRTWKYSYSVVESVKEFAVSEPPPGAVGPLRSFLRT